MANSGRKAGITRRQREIYDYLRDRIVNRGYGPTVREIGLHFDINSPNGVMCHLRALERKGLIVREQNTSRSIQLAESSQDQLNIQLIGTAAPGGAMQRAVSAEEVVSFRSVIEGDDIACLRIEGNTFAQLNIIHGDHLIVNRELAVQPGCYVVTQDDRHNVVICTVQERTNHLVPVIPGNYPSVTRQVIGVVTGVIRKFRVPQLPSAGDATPTPAAIRLTDQ